MLLYILLVTSPDIRHVQPLSHTGCSVQGKQLPEQFGAGGLLPRPALMGNHTAAHSSAPHSSEAAKAEPTGFATHRFRLLAAKALPAGLTSSHPPFPGGSRSNVSSVSGKRAPCHQGTGGPAPKVPWPVPSSPPQPLHVLPALSRGDPCVHTAVPVSERGPAHTTPASQ